MSLDSVRMFVVGAGGTDFPAVHVPGVVVEGLQSGLSHVAVAKAWGKSDVLVIADLLEEPREVRSALIAMVLEEIDPDMVIVLTVDGKAQSLDPVESYLPMIWSTPFRAELHGSLIQWECELSCFSRCHVPPPVATSGPGVFDDDGLPVLWSRWPYKDLGTVVDRDDPLVVRAVLEAQRGLSSMWFQPGFPGLIPDEPLRFRAVGGSPLRGVLCASIERPGGWVVLDVNDLVELLGRDTLSVYWAELVRLMPVQAAHALLSWARDSAPLLQSASAV